MLLNVSCGPIFIENCDKHQHNVFPHLYLTHLRLNLEVFLIRAEKYWEITQAEAESFPPQLSDSGQEFGIMSEKLLQIQATSLTGKEPNFGRQLFCPELVKELWQFDKSALSIKSLITIKKG